MRTRNAVIVAMIAGFGLGAVAVQSLHAQAKPPIYYVGENDITNPDAFAKDYLPKAKERIKAAGGRYVAAGAPTAIEGAKPMARAAVIVWDSMDAMMAWRNSDAFKENRKIGEKFATFRAFTLEGVPQ